jgi:hypothetical protein
MMLLLMMMMTSHKTVVLILTFVKVLNFIVGSSLNLETQISVHQFRFEFRTQLIIKRWTEHTADENESLFDMWTYVVGVPDSSFRMPQSDTQSYIYIYLHACNITVIKLEGQEIRPFSLWQKAE